MGAFRALLLSRRRLALLLILLALAARALVPPGFMPGSAWHTLSITICTDGSGAGHDAAVTIALPDKSGGDHADKQGGTCAFAALAFAVIGGADGLLLAAALAFVLALGLAARPAPLVENPSRLRPPLRGPPARA